MMMDDGLSRRRVEEGATFPLYKTPNPLTWQSLGKTLSRHKRINCCLLFNNKSLKIT